MSETTLSQDGAHDFDFFLGEWLVQNRKRLRILENCDEWETFTATQKNQALPGGIGNFDDFIAEAWRPGYVGMSLRIFNPETGLWSIYWLNNRNGGIDSQTGALMPPVVGKFQDGVGLFEAKDTFNGKPVIVRFKWFVISANSARWEQAFSPDDGASWETNWVMDLTRVSQ